MPAPNLSVLVKMSGGLLPENSRAGDVELYDNGKMRIFESDTDIVERQVDRQKVVDFLQFARQAGFFQLPNIDHDSGASPNVPDVTMSITDSMGTNTVTMTTYQRLKGEMRKNPFDQVYKRITDLAWESYTNGSAPAPQTAEMPAPQAAQSPPPQQAAQQPSAPPVPTPPTPPPLNLEYAQNKTAPSATPDLPSLDDLLKSSGLDFSGGTQPAGGAQTPSLPNLTMPSIAQGTPGSTPNLPPLQSSAYTPQQSPPPSMPQMNRQPAPPQQPKPAAMPQLPQQPAAQPSQPLAPQQKPSPPVQTQQQKQIPQPQQKPPEPVAKPPQPPQQQNQPKPKPPEQQIQQPKREEPKKPVQNQQPQRPEPSLPQQSQTQAQQQRQPERQEQRKEQPKREEYAPQPQREQENVQNVPREQERRPEPMPRQEQPPRQQPQQQNRMQSTGAPSQKKPSLAWEHTQELVGRLEESLHGKVIVYYAPEGHLVMDDMRYLYSHLRKLGKKKSLYVLPMMPDSDINVIWRMATLLREFCEELNVIVSDQSSVGTTMLALAADTVLMNPLGYLSPIDMPFRHDLLDSMYRQNKQVTVPLRDILMSSSGPQRSASTKGKVDAGSDSSTDPIHPLIVTAANRQNEMMQMICTNLLKLSKNKRSDDQVRAIVDKLTHGYPSEDYPITFAEAQSLGLALKETSEEANDILWDLFKFYNSITQPIMHFMNNNKMVNQQQTVIESTGRRTVYYIEQLYRGDDSEPMEQHNRWRELTQQMSVSQSGKESSQILWKELQISSHNE